MNIKVGIVGAGGMAQYHIAGFRSAGAEVVAISDVNQIAADQAAARLGIPRSFPDLAAMLAGFLKIDAVSVIVPNKFHMPVAIQALQAGMHVFCEKPPALNAIETLAMGNCAKAAGKTLMFNFNNRARPESQALMDYIRGGEPPLNTPDQALSLMRIIDAAYQSSATGAPVRIS